MSQLLAMSFDAAASPAISLSPWQNYSEDTEPSGWGIAWYPADDNAAVVIKDPISTGDTALSRVLRDWDRFRATAFVCHIRGAAKRVTQQDTQPFVRTTAGRDWVFSHNGDLRRGFRDELPLGADNSFEPVGRTDSEWAFCWLLTQLRRTGARGLADVTWPELHALLRTINACGTANFTITDGHDLVAYRGLDGSNPLHVARRVPPYSEHVLKNHAITLSFEDPVDNNRSMVLVASTPLNGGWYALQPGEMLVVRRGAITWTGISDSDKAGGVTERPATALRATSTPHQSSSLSAEAARLSADAIATAAVAADGVGMVPVGEVQAQTEMGTRDGAFDTDSPGEMVTLVLSTDSAAAGPTSLAKDATRGARPTYHDDGRMSRRGMQRGRSRVLNIEHKTVYRYDNPVERSTHMLRLQPAHGELQELLDFKLRVSPVHRGRDFEDVFGNMTRRLAIDTPYTELALTARSQVRVYSKPVLSSPERRSTIPLVWMPWQRQMMQPYLLTPELPETQLHELSEFAMSFVERQDYNLVDTLHDINQTIYADFSYVSGSTNLATTPFHVYVNRRGVCQDFANLFTCLARLLGVPARYCVGYIYTGGDYENKIQSDASHAWVEVYVPWVGWRGFDPTNGCEVGLDHVRVAVGRNYRDATPTQGTLFKGGGKEILNVQVRVEVEEEEPVAVEEPAPAAPESGPIVAEAGSAEAEAGPAAAEAGPAVAEAGPVTPDSASAMAEPVPAAAEPVPAVAEPMPDVPDSLDN
ncbi:MAG: class II glutamine amidotransferase [Myxococcota bacterium]